MAELAVPNELFGRKCSLLLFAGTVDDESGGHTTASTALDLSEFHVVFDVRSDDEEAPNNARIRVHNLSPDLVRRVKGEYQRVVIAAGYTNASYGTIFDGNIKQWGEGREGNRVDTYLDILAADGDFAYNFATVNKTLMSGSTPKQRLDAMFAAFEEKGLGRGTVVIPESGGTLPRGKVLFGLARAAMRGQVANLGSTWSIQNGKVQAIALDEYAPGEAVVLNSATGLIGRAQQTQQGVTCRCLINPRLNVGGLVKIDQDKINRTSPQKDIALPVGQLPFNQRAGVTQLADVTADGIYRVYVIEYRGDNRGQDWYADLILLAVDPVTKKVKPYG